MSLPSTAFTQVRAIESWVDRPFTEFGDTSTKVYYFRCMCPASQYTALSTGSNLASAGAAGLIASNYTDVSARWVGDVDFRSAEGGNISFVRKFAKVPPDRNDYAASTKTILPTYSKYYAFPSTFDQSEIENALGSLYLLNKYERQRVSQASYTKVVSARMHYTYSTNPSSIAIKTAEGFETLADEDGWLEVIPTGTPGVLESTKVTRWMGDIYQGVTAYEL